MDAWLQFQMHFCFLSIIFVTTICLFQQSNAQHEREILDEVPKSTTCPNSKILEIFPGNGWDSLQNYETKPIIQRQFTNCLLTSDGQYVIPDNTFSVHVQSSNLNTESEILGHWKEYTDVTAKTISSQAKFRANTFEYGNINIAGTFSIGYSKLKDQILSQKIAISRNQARYTKYIIEFKSNHFILDPNFEQSIHQIGNEIEVNPNKAKILTQFLIRDFGTHCITKVHVGAIFVIEKTFSNYVSFDKFYNSSIRSSSSTSGYNFFELFKFYSEFESKYNSETKSNIFNLHYQNQTRITNYGGRFICQAEKCLEGWINSIPNSYATIDRDGKPLWELILPELFPKVRLETLGKVSFLIKTTIEEYYKVNTHFGCMDPSSLTNFNYNANVDDNSCSSGNHNYNFTFNGIYQTCSMNVSGKNVGDICESKNLSVKNPLTGSHSCPFGTKAVIIYNGLSKVEKCKRKWYKFWKKECESSFANIETYWCSSENLEEPKTGNRKAPGILFGGIFSKSTVNPITSDESCPRNFNAIQILNNATFCIGTDHTQQNFRNSLGFGGMFTCKHENPLGKSKSDKFTEMLYEESYSCPEGYSQQIVTNIDDCYIFYCLQFHSESKIGNKLKIKRPPFIPLTALYESSDSSDVSFIDREKFTGDFGQDSGSSNIWIIWCIALSSFLVIFTIGFTIYKHIYMFKIFNSESAESHNHVNELFEYMDMEKQNNYNVKYGKVDDEEYLTKVSL